MSLTLIAFGRTAASRYRYTCSLYDYDSYGSWRLITTDTEVQIHDGYLRRADPDDVPLGELWDAFTAARAASRFFSWPNPQVVFPEYLRLLGATADVAFCWDCSQPHRADELSCGMGRDDVLVCAPCLADWPWCVSCENPFPSGDLTGTLDGTLVCGNCRRDYYNYCHHCDGWYRYGEDAGSHEHPPVPCCTSPQPEFTIRNDGCEPLASDTPVTVTLPEGVISDEGLSEIQHYLQQQATLAYRSAVTDDEMQAAQHLERVAWNLEQLGSEWQTPRGNYTKRLSSLAYKTGKVKIDPAVLSRVGCIARDHSKSAGVTIDVTRQLNKEARYFYHSDSCWWGSPGGYGDSRCALKTNGGFGMRSLSPRHGEPTGRAWVMPLKLAAASSQYLSPTFETLKPDAFMVFNGYGELSSYTAPRILASMAGWTYARVSGFSCEPMYVNAGGYLVAPQDTVARVKELYLSVQRHSRLYEREQTEARLTARLNPEDKETTHVS